MSISLSSNFHSSLSLHIILLKSLLLESLLHPMAISPRISFSHDIFAADLRTNESTSQDSYAVEFHFSIGSHISADDAAVADELFSDGKILPHFNPPGGAVAGRSTSLSPPPAVLRRPDRLHELMDSTNGSASHRRRRSFWRFGRSSSVGGEVKSSVIFPFSLSRSKSTGSFPNPPQRRPQAADRKKTYYYSGSERGSCGGGGVRIGPVLNMPAPMISRGGENAGDGVNAVVTGGVFTYLLCSCGGEGN